MNYNIIVTRKNIKNLILKIKVDGQILLSVPNKTSNKYIEEFIKSKEEWIEKTFLKIKENPQKKEELKYESGESIKYLGKEYILNIVESSKVAVELSDRHLNIFISKDRDKNQLETVIYKWYLEKAKELFLNLSKKYTNLLGVKLEELKIRKMKSCWGNCRYHKKIITLNLELIKTPIEFVEYVVLHEVAHLVYPNHQKEYWNYVSKYMPNWKERRKIAKNIRI